ncbi:MAG: hypothetical protein EBQ80_02360 [Proteobacteria bacterium]|nr:hypothetical protein [Pseudomonadota bacterium]
MLVLAVSGLVPSHYVIAAEVGTVERIAIDPHGYTRDEQEIQLKNLPIECVENLSKNAGQGCPQPCMIEIPLSALPKNDSCDGRTWTCAWPTQPVAENPTCPTGWNGNYSVDRYYEIRNCGAQLFDTGKTEVKDASTCTRDRTETKTEQCPANIAGGNWSGNGVTYTRTMRDELATDLTTTAKSTIINDWKVSAVDCHRIIYKQVFVPCVPNPALPDNGACITETSQQNGGTLYKTTCAAPVLPPMSAASTVVHQTLDMDLQTVHVISHGNVINLRHDCPTKTTYGWIGYEPPYGDGEGGTGGEGGAGGDGCGCDGSTPGEGDSDGCAGAEGEGEGEGEGDLG